MTAACCCRDEDLYSSTNGSSRYWYDPSYGGKINVSGFQAARADGAAPALATPPHMEPPRIVHAPDYTDHLRCDPYCGACSPVLQPSTS